MSTEAEIRGLFEKHNVSLGKADVWFVQGNPVIRHKALERLAAAINVTYEPPQILRAECDEAVILVTGRLRDKGTSAPSEWSIGEARIDQNYRVSGKQAAYPFAMAEKRAKDRVILKLAHLHGAYSEDEADEFRSAAPSLIEKADVAITSGIGDGPGQLHRSEPAEPVSFDDKIRAKIDKAQEIGEVSALMLEPSTQKLLTEMASDRRDELRAYAKARLIALGWPKREASHAVEDREEA